MADHTEAVQVEFDPSVTSYSALLEFFWENHDPTSPKTCSRQYMSAIFYNSPSQQTLAEASLEKRQEAGEVTTKVLPLSNFTVAEEYHQKYLLQQEGWLMTQLDLEPGEELIQSHLAARLNGYIAGFGDEATFEGEIGPLGLSKKVADFVIKKIRQKREESQGAA